MKEIKLKISLDISEVEDEDADAAFIQVKNDLTSFFSASPWILDSIELEEAEVIRDLDADADDEEPEEEDLSDA